MTVSSFPTELMELAEDPLIFQRLCWPDITLYDKQVEILYSVRDNDETFVPAGNQLGKDFIAGLCVLWFFCSRSPCRIVTTSVDHSQLKSVLWGEIKNFIRTSKMLLPIEELDLELRQTDILGNRVDKSYVIARVAKKGEGMQGHHLPERPHTLAVFDEASGVDDETYTMSDSWAHRKLVIGNPLPTTNFFYKGVRDGNMRAPNNGHFYRNVIRIKADDSPSVQLAKERMLRDKEPGNAVLIPGVIDYSTYMKRRQLWDPIRQCIGLDGEFYEGAEVLLFPPEWLNRAENTVVRDPVGKTIGVDTAEGGDSTVWTVVNEQGILYQEELKTPDTSMIPGRTIALINQYKVRPKYAYFDRGGGGKQIADVLRRQGYPVSTVGFGESASRPTDAWEISNPISAFRDTEERYTYRNRRAEMYGCLRLLLDPAYNPDGFAIPGQYLELRRQLAPLPLLWDEEGRLYLPPKRHRPGVRSPTTESIEDIIGRSPDHADSLVLATYALSKWRPMLKAI